MVGDLWGKRFTQDIHRYTDRQVDKVGFNVQFDTPCHFRDDLPGQYYHHQCQYHKQQALN